MVSKLQQKRKMRTYPLGTVDGKDTQLSGGSKTQVGETGTKGGDALLDLVVCLPLVSLGCAVDDRAVTKELLALWKKYHK